MYVIRNKRTGTYFAGKGALTADVNLAVWFNADAASRFLRKARHPGKWEKVELGTEAVREF